MKKHVLLLTFLMVSCARETIIPISMETELGPIQLELYPDRAPITVSNFLRYVDENRYEDFHFYRVVHMENQPDNDVKIEVIQGGLGFDKHPMELPTIVHETTDKTGIRHLNGTLSMARLEPGTASSEIFICINDQPELDYSGKRNPDGQGFAAFGKVISGMDVIRKIQLLPETKQMLDKVVKVNSIQRNGDIDRDR
ncbi:MAG: peptidylprolyl isomerase [Candidatus Marinimicrobia bacterium]|nr:peptidylprolyl isomerase [Candidatus Neomarinimicrobiota bacterium]